VTTATVDALSGLGRSPEAVASTLSPSLSQRAVDRVSGWLARRTSRRGFLVRAGLLGSALAVDPFGYVLRPGTAYAAVCGPGASCTSGWTVFCATINNGVNACPPGSIAAGWWKADGASLCGGRARYIIDCNATCARCTTPGARAGICSSSCWNCSCTCGPAGSCDSRKVCCNAFRYGQCNTQVRQVGGVTCRVVSCTPPWRFENCSTAPATDNRTVNHSSDRLPQAWTPITARYTAIGENGSVLGATINAEVAVRGGRAQRYQSGRISWSQRTGARETVGAIAARYVALGAEGGWLGFPTASPVAVPGGGAASRFQHGRISWSASTGAWETWAHITLRYEREGAERSQLGYPVAAVAQLPGGGRLARFQSGYIGYAPGIGAHVVRDGMAILWVANGGVQRLGLPLGDERVVRNGMVVRSAANREERRQDFQRGSISVDRRTGRAQVSLRS
jgi:hypothetical protein